MWSRVADSLSWSPGHSGKGYLLDSGSIRSWNVDPYEPLDHHQVHQRNLEFSPIALNFEIDPDGGVVTAQPTPRTESIIQTDPRLYDAGQREVAEDEWDLDNFPQKSDKAHGPDYNFVMSMALRPEDAQSYIDQYGPYLEHWTKAENVPAIMRQGIHPATHATEPALEHEEAEDFNPDEGHVRRNWDGFIETRPGYTYLARPGTLGSGLHGNHLKQRPYEVPLRVDLRQLQPHRFEADEDAARDLWPDWVDQERQRIRQEEGRQPDDYEPDWLEPPNANYWDAESQGLGGWADQAGLDDPQWTNDSLAQKGTIAYAGRIPPEAISLHPDYMDKYPPEAGGLAAGQMSLFSSWHLADGPYGYTNWDTAEVALTMDNDRQLTEASRKLVEKGGTPQDLRDWALRKIISPHNREQIKDAQEWNDIPFEERQKRKRDSDISQFGEEAVNLGQGLMQPFEDWNNEGKSEEDIEREQEYEAPDLIDFELVNWDELHQGILDEFDEDAEFDRTMQERRDLGLGWATNHDLPHNQMRDAFMRSMGAVPEEEIGGSYSQYSKDPRYRPTHNIPFATFRQIPGWERDYKDYARNALWDHRYPIAEQKARDELLARGWTREQVEQTLNETGAFAPDYVKKHFPGGKYDTELDMNDPDEAALFWNTPEMQDVQQRGRTVNVDDLANEVTYAVKAGRPHPYIPQMQQALQQRGYTPEQISQIMQQQYRYDPETNSNVPIEPPVDQWAQQAEQQRQLDQPGSLTIPEEWHTSSWEWSSPSITAGIRNTRYRASGYWHVAPTSERARIQQHGLHPSDPAHSGMWTTFDDGKYDPPRGVYISPNRKWTDGYRTRLEFQRGVPHDIWEIDDPGGYTYPDPDLGLNSRYVMNPIASPRLVEGPEHRAEMPEYMMQGYVRPTDPWQRGPLPMGKGEGRGQPYPQNDPEAWKQKVGKTAVADAPHMLAPAVELREWLADLGGSEPEPPSIHHDSLDDFVQSPAATQRTTLPYFPPANVPKQSMAERSGIPELDAAIEEFMQAEFKSEDSALAWEMIRTADAPQTSWHLTDNPQFALDPEHVSFDNTFAIEQRTSPGLYTGDPNFWFSHPEYHYARPFAAEIEHPPVDRERWGGENFIPAEMFPQSRIKRVIPIDHYVRERYGDPGHVETHHDYSETPYSEMPRYPGYRYEGPDVRDMTPEQAQHYIDRTDQYFRAMHPEAFHVDAVCPRCKTDSEVYGIPGAPNSTNANCQMCGHQFPIEGNRRTAMTDGSAYYHVALQRDRDSISRHGLDYTFGTPQFTNEVDDWDFDDEDEADGARDRFREEYAHGGPMYPKANYLWNTWDEARLNAHPNEHDIWEVTHPSLTTQPDPWTEGARYTTAPIDPEYMRMVSPSQWDRTAATRTADSPITQADATNDPLGKNPAIIPSRQGDPDYLEDSICPHCQQLHRADEPCPDSAVRQYQQMERQWGNRDPNSVHQNPHGPGIGPTGLDDQQMDLGSISSVHESMPWEPDPVEFPTGKQVWVDYDADRIHEGDPEQAEDFENWIYNIDPHHYQPEPNFHEDFWRQPYPLYHGTTEEHVPSIEANGLTPQNKTRGTENRWMGSAIFSSPEPHTPAYHYGDHVYEIDAPKMKAEGYMPHVTRDANFQEDENRESVARRLGWEDWFTEGNYDGTDPSTVVFHEPIPRRYLNKVDGLENRMAKITVMAAKTRTQQLQEKQRFEQEFGPDQAEVFHQFPDGWTLRALRSPHATCYEGEMQPNCLGSAKSLRNYVDQTEWHKPSEHVPMASLRDPDNIPHATMIHPTESDLVDPRYMGSLDIEGGHGSDAQRYVPYIHDYWTNTLGRPPMGRDSWDWHQADPMEMGSPEHQSQPEHGFSEFRPGGFWNDRMLLEGDPEYGGMPHLKRAVKPIKKAWQRIEGGEPYDDVAGDLEQRLLNNYNAEQVGYMLSDFAREYKRWQEYQPYSPEQMEPPGRTEFPEFYWMHGQYGPEVMNAVNQAQDTYRHLHWNTPHLAFSMLDQNLSQLDLDPEQKQRILGAFWDAHAKAFQQRSGMQAGPEGSFEQPQTVEQKIQSEALERFQQLQPVSTMEPGELMTTIIRQLQEQYTQPQPEPQVSPPPSQVPSELPATVPNAT